MQQNQPPNILVVEDDDDHYFLTEKILRDGSHPTRLHRVVNGEEMMDFLYQRGAFAGPPNEPQPNLVILDINMPKKNGWEALKEMKSDPHLRRIPVVVMTTSDIDEDKYRCYDLGANSYIRKPLDLKNWVKILEGLTQYWFEMVDLPSMYKKSQ